MGLVCRNPQRCPKHELFVSRTTTLSPQLRIVKTLQSCRHTSGSCKGGERNVRRRYGHSTFRRATVRLAEHDHVRRTLWLTRLSMPRLGLDWNITSRAAVCLCESISPVLQTARRERRRCGRAICERFASESLIPLVRAAVDMSLLCGGLSQSERRNCDVLSI
jgi:hypothetical protein